MTSDDSGISGPKVTRINGAANCANNLIIFGLPEVESLPDLKKSVDELLNFLVGKSVPLSDLFRLGRRMKSSDSVPPARPRPVLLKLLSAWDRRLILSVICKLKGFRVTGMYIREDLSQEQRQKHRERSGTPKAADAVVGSNLVVDSSIQSQSSRTQPQPPSPLSSSSSVNVSGSSAQGAQ